MDNKIVRNKVATTSVPPDQESPNHIFNALNNFCIQEIVRRLSIDDFLSAAETCTKFREITRNSFRVIFPTDFQFAKEKDEDTEVLANRIEKLQNIFGDLIEKIVWGNRLEYTREDISSINIDYVNLKEDRDLDVNRINLLADQFGTTLKELKITNSFIDINVLSKFRALEKLEIDNCRNCFVFGLFF